MKTHIILFRRWKSLSICCRALKTMQCTRSNVDNVTNVYSETTQPITSVINKLKHLGWCHDFRHLDAEYDWEYLLDKHHSDAIEQNVAARKTKGDIHHLNKEREVIRCEMLTEASKLPNLSHPETPIGPECNARLVTTIGTKPEFSFTPKSTSYLGRRHGILRTGQVSMTTGHRSYYFLDDLVRLEEALVEYTLSRLKEAGFTLVSVPDLLHPSIIESCGFPTTGERTQVYKLDGRHGDVCLAGTSEMALAGMLMNETYQLCDLPLKFAAVSRCFRAETSGLKTEKDLYRVHQFTKVEMFGVTANETGEESDILQTELLDMETNLFRDLGLYFRILEMPTEELGNSAYRKFDIEAWMPEKQFWGEISSTSNCTDYQSRRLSIKYRTPQHTKHVHTVNGTACAVPRMVMTILENNQTQDGSITIPSVLQPFMGGMDTLTRTGASPYRQYYNPSWVGWTI